MKFLKTYLLFFFVFTVIGSYSQTLGDFRSYQDGNWNNPASWEYFDGSSWISPPTNTNYPGDGIVTAYDVSIISNHTINLNTNITNPINSLTIGDQNGGINSISTLLIGTSNGNNTYQLNTNQISTLYDGLMEWGNNHTLVLPSGTLINIEQNSPYNPTTELGTDYGLYDDGTCNTQMQIQIGSTLYANCNGNGGSPSSFEDINTSGGNLTVSPSSNSPICSGQTLNLFANVGGTEADTASFTWSVISSPVPYSFTSTSEDPVDDPGPTTAGTYIYEVTASSGTSPNIVTTTNTVTVTVNSLPIAPTGVSEQTFCSSNNPTIANLSATGTNIQWYSASTGGSALINTTPVTTNVYYASQTNANNCESTDRLAVNVIVSGCRVVTNRRITYRVKK